MRTVSKLQLEGTYTSQPNTLGIYLFEDRLGDNDKYIFDESFIHLVRYALSSDCISEMSEKQIELLNEYLVDALDGQFESALNEALDRLMVNMTNNADLSGQIICGNSNLHTYTPYEYL